MLKTSFERIGAGGGRLIVPLLAVLMLAGCGMGTLSGGIGSFTGSAPADESVNQDSLLAAAKQDGTDVLGTAGGASTCPIVTVASADQTLTVYAEGANDALSIMHRGEISKTARECRIQPGSVTVKYGFAGRVLLGPKGAPGIISMPLMATLVDQAGQPLQTQPVSVQVEINPAQPIGYFSTVQTIQFLLQPGQRPADFKLAIAFDKESVLPAELQGLKAAKQKAGKAKVSTDG